MGFIYTYGIIAHGWHLFLLNYCTLVAFIHSDLLYMGGIYSFGLIVPGWHLLIWTNCTCVSFTHMD